MLSGYAASIGADTVCARLNGGFIRIYDEDDAMLVELRYSPIAYSPAIDGVAEARDIETGIAIADGKAVFSRYFEADGSKMVFDGSVGIKGAKLNLDRVEIEKGAPVTITSHTFAIDRS